VEILRERVRENSVKPRGVGHYRTRIADARRTRDGSDARRDDGGAEGGRERDERSDSRATRRADAREATREAGAGL